MTRPVVPFNIRKKKIEVSKVLGTVMNIYFTVVDRGSASIKIGNYLFTVHEFTDTKLHVTLHKNKKLISEQVINEFCNEQEDINQFEYGLISITRRYIVGMLLNAGYDIDVNEINKVV